MGFYFHARASRRMARPPPTDDLPALHRVTLIHTFFVCEMTHPTMRNTVLSPAGSVQVNSRYIVVCSYGGTVFVSPTETCKLQHSWLNLPAKTTTPTTTTARWCSLRRQFLLSCASSQTGTRRAAVAGGRAQGPQARRGRGRSVGAALARDSRPSRQPAGEDEIRHCGLRDLPKASP